MAEIKLYQGYPPSTGRIPKPDTPVQPNIVTVRDGRPVKYPGCEGIGVRVVHPSNPDAPGTEFRPGRVLRPAARGAQAGKSRE